MHTISQSIGNYHHTIRISDYDKNNTVEVRRGNKTLYSGIATHIIDNGNRLTFKDKEGKQHEYIKFMTYTTA